ncbi:hypothetical protein IEQ34_022274 [Dendrobium chrysotoxum]|uniref:Uncharacterized protein n=1 Tax=Dendrobium chrysotoxum TaxID=161865 RepID=A0AAV7FYI0_DENCH|nr:hypothetical protein IEQ34_022274 [Dendrobium chrysotoxum]
MKDLPVHLHVGEEAIHRILNIPGVKHLLFENRYLTKYIEEEFLFKVGLSIQAGRLEAKMLKKSSKAHELPAPSSKIPSKQKSDNPPALLKKKKLEGISTRTGQLSHCMELEVKFMHTLNEWNDEFVKVKYLQGEYKRKYNHKSKAVNELEVELTDCRTELANSMTASSLKNQQIDRLQIELVEAQEMITQLLKDQNVSGEKVVVLEAKNKKSRTLIAEKETALFGLEFLRIIEDFKKFIDFKISILDHLQEAREHIYNVEVKASPGGFLKGVQLVQRKTGVKFDGLTTS